VGVFAILIYGSNVGRKVKQFCRQYVFRSSKPPTQDRYRYRDASSIPMHYGSQAAVYTTYERPTKADGSDDNGVEMTQLHAADSMHEEIVPSIRAAALVGGRLRQPPVEVSRTPSHGSSSDVTPNDRTQLEQAMSEVSAPRSLHRDLSEPRAPSEAGHSVVSRKSINSVERGFTMPSLPLEQEFATGAAIVVNNRNIAQVQSVLGEGAFGRVYHVHLNPAHSKSEDVGEDQRGPSRAMKVSRFDSTGTSYAKNLAQLCDEAAIALHVGTHPNLVALRYMCRDESARLTQDSYLLFYDFIDGVNLYTALTAECFLWTQNGAKVGAHEMELRLFSLSYQLLRALEYIHDRHVLHQDVKPQNIMVDGNGRLRLTDFGLACHVPSTPPGGVPVGYLNGYSRTYYSPEIAKHVQHMKSTIKIGETRPLEIEPRTSDLWAAALTILQIYCGGRVQWQQGHGENGQKAFDAYR
jgi:hypothetical protein